MIPSAQFLTRTLMCFALSVSPLPVIAAPVDTNTDDARAAYEEGKQAFRLGKFESAAASFERAYELSDLPDILYNIGLAHLRWYDIDPDVGHLRTARAVLQNYVLEVQSNPDLGDLTEAEQLIAEAEQLIAEAEAKSVDTEAEDTEPEEPAADGADAGPDSGRGLRLGGAVAMGLGGALIVGGVVGGVVFGLRGQAAQDDLVAAYADRDEMGCTEAASSDACTEIFDRLEAHRSEGQRANGLAYGVGVGLGVAGVVAVTIGAVLFARGKKASSKAQVSVAPAWMARGGGGAVITGRF